MGASARALDLIDTVSDMADIAAIGMQGGVDPGLYSDVTRASATTIHNKD